MRVKKNKKKKLVAAEGLRERERERCTYGGEKERGPEGVSLFAARFGGGACPFAMSKNPDCLLHKSSVK